MAGLSKSATSRAFAMAVIETAISLERLVLDCLVVAINNDVKALRTDSKVNFPAHLQDDVVEFIIVGNGYFDFRGGKSGVISAMATYVEKTHWVVVAAQGLDATVVDRLILLRNWAAHESSASARKARSGIGAPKAQSAGSWIKVGSRMEELLDEVESFAQRIEAAAPF